MLCANQQIIKRILLRHKFSSGIQEAVVLTENQNLQFSTGERNSPIRRVIVFTRLQLHVITQPESRRPNAPFSSGISSDEASACNLKCLFRPSIHAGGFSCSAGRSRSAQGELTLMSFYYIPWRYSIIFLDVYLKGISFESRLGYPLYSS